MSAEQEREREAPSGDASPEAGRGRGRPVLGAVSGLLFGVFLAVTLQQFAVRPLDNLSVIALPLLGLVLGLALGRWAPLSKRRAVEG